MMVYGMHGFEDIGAEHVRAWVQWKIATRQWTMWGWPMRAI